MNPLVSIITPTWQRPLQLARCVDAVARQTYRPLQHVIVSDHDPGLLGTDLHRYLQQASLHFGHQILFDMLPTHEEPGWWGHRARLRGLELAEGSLVGWCDDDDTLRPGHVEAHAAALAEHPDAWWSFSRVWIGPWRCNTPVPVTAANERAIHGGPGWPDPASIHGPQTMLHRAEITRWSTWRPEPGPEWRLVQRWMAAGLGWVFVDEVTVDAYQHDDYYEHIYGRQVCGLETGG